ncbi:MAG: OmpH family outer membrane protein [Niabella sp.]
MKNALIAINALLAVAVGFLLYKQFNAESKTKIFAKDANEVDSLANKKVLFAYIDMDSIQFNFEAAKVVQKEIEKKQSSVSYEMETMEKAFKAKVAGYQKKGPTMTPAEEEAARQDIEAAQADMFNKRQMLADDFDKFVAGKNMNLRKKIKDFLKEYNADGTYSFIFSYEPNFFYYNDTAFNITSQVIRGLNAKYKAEKK